MNSNIGPDCSPGFERQARYLVGPDRNNRWIEVRGDSVVSEGVGTAPYIDGATVIPCSSGVLLDGDVNAHTHLYSGLAPLGMPAPAVAPENFVQILQRIWWKLDRALDAESLYASAAYYVANALTYGTTTLVDHHESPDFIEGSLDVLADVCRTLGMRALLTYGATERNFGRSEAKQGLNECRRLIQQNQNPDLVRGLVGLHASFTVSDETIRDAADLCQQLGVPLHVHLAEDMADVDDASARGYAGPLERLARLGALVPNTILAHGVHLSVAQVQAAVANGCWLVSNPRSNKGNRVGYGVALHGVKEVALGTDGYPADMREEMLVGQQEASLHGCSEHDVPMRAKAGQMLIAKIWGHQFGCGVGQIADFVVREPDGFVSQVFVGGRWVIQHGKLATANHDEIRFAAHEQARVLWTRMKNII